MSKRANGEGSIYKMADGRWRAVIDLGTGADGRRRRKSKIAKRRADAVALLRELQAERESGFVAQSGPPRLTDYLSQWLSGLSTRSAPNTIALYRNAIDRHIDPVIGGVRLDKLTAVQVMGLLNSWRDSGVGNRTQQVGLAVLSHALQSASEIGLIRSNPAAKIKPPKSAREEIDPFGADEVRRIIEAARVEDLHLAPIVLLFACGLRFGEMAGLPRRCVDLAAGTIRIEQQLTTDAGTGKTILGPTKTTRSRRNIDLPEIAIDALSQHLALMVSLGRAGDDLLFRGRQGGYLANRNFRERPWKRTLARAEVRERPPHHARHTYATLALSAGVPVHVVSAVLGHSRASITLDLYSHYLPAHQQSARDAIGKLIG